MAGTPKQRLIVLLGAAASAAVIRFVGFQEGTVPYVYRDPIGVLTSCTGHTGPELRFGQMFTPEECNDQLAADLQRTALDVMKCTAEPLSANEKAAYVSFAFNVGTGAYCTSTLHRKLTEGDHIGACRELMRWTLAGGKQWPGLVKRRAAERDLCLTP